MEKPTIHQRLDYRPPDYIVDTVHLEFQLEESRTRVRARLAVHRREDLLGDPPPFVLSGENLELCGVWLDGGELSQSEYVVSDEELSVASVPARFEFETQVEINPLANEALSGLYCSGSIFCTQCEAMGFRRITYFPDRPDIMARYTTVIEADAERYPVLLSNGNCVADEALEGGRRRVIWEDPFPKPSYLFALVAGDLRCYPGSFTTMSGRDVKLEIWVEPQNIDRCEYALASLQNAMKWDEEVFGREYDLDIYMIVAVNDFNMGAMENKGLNVFNSKYVLADPESASDDDCLGIEGVIGHEYFHNWTGNRVTCRDWFQLTLKEGLTVFRDQLFSADMTSHAVKRIADVNTLRVAQFAEDAGPMAHPIRPESYISMDNFYTATVYNKGAEVIRMLHTLLGADGFRNGSDLYFERHDGQAVTCDDFVAAMEDANEFDATRFKRWYSQSGTPLIEAEGRYDEGAQEYTLSLRQSNPAPVEVEAREPLHIPIAMGLLGRDGGDLPLVSEHARVLSHGGCLIELTEAQQNFSFSGISEPPVPSLLRGFSAPVRLRMKREPEDLAFLMAHDSDSFSRWEAGQELATRLLLSLSDRARTGEDLESDALFSEAFRKLLSDPDLDNSLKALALSLPAEKVLGQECEVIHVDALFEAREFLRCSLAQEHQVLLLEIYHDLAVCNPEGSDKDAMAARHLKNVVLAYLVSQNTPEMTHLASQQFGSARNMTDSQASLSLLADVGGREAQEALAQFYERWKHDPLVLDKWFSVQALSRSSDTLERVVALSQHPDFSLKNPNRLRSLVGSFCAGNQVRFHTESGAGYRFLADAVTSVDAFNPQMAARLVSQFNQWKRFDEDRRALMQESLEGIAGRKDLSKDVFEIVERALKD